MAKKTYVPDAWEDDWEAQADRAAAEPEASEPPSPAPRLSKAERLARHAEENRKLWESADAPPETLHFLKAQSTGGGGGVPLGTPTISKPIRVLSRRPPPTAPVSLARKGGGVALSLDQLTLNDGDGGNDDDDEKEAEPVLSPEEIREKQAREREEKRRRYEEARARIFGEPTPTSDLSAASTSASPGPQQQQQQKNGRVSPPRGQRGRGGRGRGWQFQDKNRRNGSPASAPGTATPPREIYDPNYAPKPAFTIQKRHSPAAGGQVRPSEQPPQQQPYQPIREPRIPGRGAGFGSARGR